MRTEKQAQASRENGSQSNGPITDAGKAAVSQNASFETFSQKYGITPVLTSPEFGIILSGLVDDLCPQGLMQGILVERIASFVWKLRRLARAEALLLEGKVQPGNTNSQFQSEREAHWQTPEGKKLFAEMLADHEKQHGKPIEPPPPGEDEVYAKSFIATDRALERMQGYELKLQKALQATLREFRRLQKHQGSNNDQDPMTNKDLSVNALSPNDEIGNPNQTRRMNDEDLATNLHESAPMKANAEEEFATADERGCTQMNANQTDQNKNDQIKPGAATPDGSKSYLRSSAFICGSNPDWISDDSCPFVAKSSISASNDPTREKTIKIKPGADLGTSVLKKSTQRRSW